MEVRYERDSGFEPFALKLKFDSEEEVERIYALFNYPPIINALNIGAVAQAVRDAIKERPAGAPKHQDALGRLCEKLSWTG